MPKTKNKPTLKYESMNDEIKFYSSKPQTENKCELEEVEASSSSTTTHPKTNDSLDMDALKNSAFYLHVKPFLKDGAFCPSTVAAGLKKMHSSAPEIKGTLIASANSNHAGCSFFGGTKIKLDPKTGFAHHYHLGTTRIWNHDGSINEAMWKEFVKHVTTDSCTGDQPIPKSKMMEYLAYRLEVDLEETGLGRCPHETSSKWVQATMATQAWNEVYDRLASSWVPKGDSLEPAMSLDDIRLFFVNSGKAFAYAESGVLPEPRPGF